MRIGSRPSRMCLGPTAGWSPFGIRLGSPFKWDLLEARDHTGRRRANDTTAARSLRADCDGYAPGSVGGSDGDGGISLISLPSRHQTHDKSDDEQAGASAAPVALVEQASVRDSLGLPRLPTLLALRAVCSGAHLQTTASGMLHLHRGLQRGRNGRRIALWSHAPQGGVP